MRFHTHSFSRVFNGRAPLSSLVARNSQNVTRVQKRFFTVEPHKGVGPDPRYRSLADQTPRFVTGVLGVALASAVISTITYFELIQMQENRESQLEAEKRREWLREVDSHAVNNGGSGSSEANCAAPFLSGYGPKFVEEPVTNTWFPVVVPALSGSGALQLVSTSVRCMLNMCTVERARAYSYALYLSPQAVKAANAATDMNQIHLALCPMDQCGDESSADFEASPRFTGAKPGWVFKTGEKGLGYYLDAGSPEMMLRLVLARDIAGGHLAKGFDKSMLWRIRKAQQGSRTGSGKTAMKQFTKFFSKCREWEKGTTIDFTMSTKGTLVVKARKEDGQPVAQQEFKSSILAWALFDVYLGEKGHMSASCRAELRDEVQKIVQKAL